MNTRSRNWPRCFDLSSSGTSTTQVRSERETENQGVTENFVFVSCGTAVQLERHGKIRDIFCGTAVQLECHKKKHNISCHTAVYIQLDYTIAHSVLWYCHSIPLLLSYCTVLYCTVINYVHLSNYYVLLRTLVLDGFGCGMYGVLCLGVLSAECVVCLFEGK